MQTSSGNPLDSDELAGFEGWLARSLYRFDCPESHTLGEYALDLLEPRQRTSTATHVLDCEHCQGELTVLREFMATPLELPESTAQRVRRRLATLFSPAPGRAYGLRGTAESSARVYEVEGLTVTVAPGGESGSLVGLVVSDSMPPEQLAGREVRLVPSAGPPTSVELDDFGNFELSGLRPAAYALEIDLLDSVIVIEELQVR